MGSIGSRSKPEQVFSREDRCSSEPSVTVNRVLLTRISSLLGDDSQNLRVKNVNSPSLVGNGNATGVVPIPVTQNLGGLRNLWMMT